MLAAWPSHLMQSRGNRDVGRQQVVAQELCGGNPGHPIVYAEFEAAMDYLCVKGQKLDRPARIGVFTCGNEITYSYIDPKFLK